MPPKLKLTSALAPSTALADLDAAIRSLEISTNPTLRKACGCNATRHALLTSTPNCLNCGRIICVKEGLGPCPFCSMPLLSADDTQAMIRALKEERGREKMAADKVAHKRADVSKASRPFASQSSSSSALTAAEEHRNKLLSYQATSAKRTHIIDEAADFETPSSRTSMWATPQERALQLKRQQKVLREQEWNAKPEYEKRRAVVAIDLVGGKVVKRMGDVERPASDEEGEQEIAPIQGDHTSRGAFGQNPLLGPLIRPVYNPDKGKDVEDASKRRQKTWRRVQDDYGDNEEIILDGGIYGQTSE